MYIVLAVILTGIMLVGTFILGALFCKHIVEDAQAEARYDAIRNEYYRMAGVRNVADPRPYVPPRPKAPRANLTMLPGMNKLERMMREGKRGTIMWRAGDRNKNAG